VVGREGCEPARVGGAGGERKDQNRMGKGKPKSAVARTGANGKYWRIGVKIQLCRKKTIKLNDTTNETLKRKRGGGGEDRGPVNGRAFGLNNIRK